MPRGGQKVSVRQGLLLILLHSWGLHELNNPGMCDCCGVFSGNAEHGFFLFLMCILSTVLFDKMKGCVIIQINTSDFIYLSTNDQLGPQTDQ